MARNNNEVIRWGMGPYWVDKDTAESVAKTAKYRHYKPDELEILRLWIRTAPIVGNYYFDAYLMTPQAEEIARRMSPGNLRSVIPWLKRVDCLVSMGDKFWIIEVKDRLRASGIGQLEVYENLFRRMYGGGRPIIKGYVYRVDDPALHPVCEEKGIRRWHLRVPGGYGGY